MVAAARAKDVSRYLCAAGVLSHYVGDASQPLHGSVLADGYKDRPKTVVHHKRDTGEEYTTDSNAGAGVHSAYETKMLDRHAADIIRALPDVLKRIAAPARPVKSGRDAALATLNLMQRTARRLPPASIVDAYIKAGDVPTTGVQDALWEQFGYATVETMADGAQVLALLWRSAWAAGGGDKIQKADLKQVSQTSLMRLYQDKTFLPSQDLDSISFAAAGATSDQS